MQKLKFHNPTKTMTIVQSNGDRVTIKSKHTVGMEKIVEIMEQYKDAMLVKFDAFRKNHNLSTPEYNEQLIKALAPFSEKISELSAKLGAAYLVANNIAHRGERLHVDTAMKKLNKMNHYGNNQPVVTRMHIQECNSLRLQHANDFTRDIRYFLLTDHGVTLMDETAYLQCMVMIDKLRNSESYNPKKLQRYQNFAKKFHASVIKNAKTGNQNAR